MRTVTTQARTLRIGRTATFDPLGLRRKITRKPTWTQARKCCSVHIMDIAEKAWHRADQLSEVGLMGASAIRGVTGTAAAPDIPGGTQSIQRAVAVLRILATARDTGLGLTEISVQAALPHPTAHRILRILIAEGIVEQKPGTRRYVIGEQIPLLALSRRTRDPLLDVVVPHLKAAVGEIGDAGFFTRRAGFDTVCVARQLGAYPVQVLAWDVGERRPLGVSNAGVAILSACRPTLCAAYSPRTDRAFLVWGFERCDFAGGSAGPRTRLRSSHSIPYSGGKRRVGVDPLFERRSAWRYDN
jgi:hypothetical protein